MYLILDLGFWIWPPRQASLFVILIFDNFGLSIENLSTLILWIILHIVTENQNGSTLRDNVFTTVETPHLSNRKVAKVPVSFRWTHLTKNTRLKEINPLGG